MEAEVTERDWKVEEGPRAKDRGGLQKLEKAR